MATKCPNKNHPDWQKLVNAVGESAAYVAYQNNDYQIPDYSQRPIFNEIKERYSERDAYRAVHRMENPSSEIGYTLRAVDILQSDNAEQVFSKGKKNNWDLKKILTELQVPKQQKQIILNTGLTDRAEIASELVTNYSFTVETDVAVSKVEIFDTLGEHLIREGSPEEGANWVIESEHLPTEKFDTRKQATDWIENKQVRKPTKYYRNMTVPGGTNYTENRIITPQITPTIKGHAQFAESNDIGWFRSDEQSTASTPFANLRYEKNEKAVLPDGTPITTFEVWSPQAKVPIETFRTEQEAINFIGATKIRRILEFQSDLFQKGRSVERLVERKEVMRPGTRFFDLDSQREVELIGFQDYVRESDGAEIPATVRVKDVETGGEFTIMHDGKRIDLSKFVEPKSVQDKNQFLQLLNKDNNWATFFTKSIIQDSAKKGYESVLFPKGDTASKVEGQETLESFIAGKKERIKTLEGAKEKYIKESPKVGTKIQEIDQSAPEGVDLYHERTLTQEDFNRDIARYQDEINQLKQELKRIEQEGLSALQPIWNFYENTVGRILQKQGYAPIEITDEFGNSWNMVEISPARDMTDIQFRLVDPTIENVQKDGMDYHRKPMVSSKLANEFDSANHRRYKRQSERAAKRWLKERFPDNDVHIYNSALQVGSKVAHGYFKNTAFHLWSQMEMGTHYHEAFHGAFRMYLNSEQQAQILQEASETYKVPRGEELNIEEVLAEKFREYVMTEQATERTLPAKIAKFFRDLYQYIKAIVSDSVSIDQVFSMLEGNRFPSRMMRNIEHFKPVDQTQYALRPGFTERTQNAVLNTITSVLLDIRSEMMAKGTVPTPRRLFPAVRKWFLTNAYSDSNGNPLPEHQAFQLYVMETTMESLQQSGKTQEAQEINERYQEIIEDFDAFESASDKVPLRPDGETNHEIFLDIFDNWNDRTHRDTGNISVLGWETLIARKLPAFGLRVSQKSPHKVNETEIVDQDAEFEGAGEENIQRIWDRAHFEESMKDKMSGEVRQFITTIKKDDVNELGFREYYPMDEVWSDIVTITANKRDYSAMISDLQRHAAYKPALGKVVRELENQGNELKTQFYNHFRSVFTDFVSLREKVEYTKGEDGKIIDSVNKISLSSTNQNAMRRKIMSKYARNAFEYDASNPRHLYKEIIKDGKTTLDVNVDRINDIAPAAVRLEEYLNDGQATEVTDQSIQDLQTVLYNLGMMDNSPETLEILKTYIENGETLDGRHYFGKNLISFLHLPRQANNYRALQTLIAGVAEVELSQGGKVHRPVSAKTGENVLDIYSQYGRVIERIANIEARFATDIGGTFVNSQGKTIYPFNLPTQLDDTLSKIKDGTLFSKYKDEYYSDPQFNPVPSYPEYQSIYYDLFTREDSTFRNMLSSTTFEAFQRRNEETATMDYGELHTVTSMIVRLNAFLNNNHHTEAQMALPTPADRGRMSFIPVPRVHNQRGMDILKALGKVDQRNLWKRYLIQDAVRINQERKFISENKEENSDSFVENWHYVKNKDGSRDYTAGNALKFTQIVEFQDVTITDPATGQTQLLSETDFEGYLNREANSNLVGLEHIDQAINEQIDNFEKFIDQKSQELYDLIHDGQIIKNQRETKTGEITYLDKFDKVTKSVDNAAHSLDVAGFSGRYNNDVMSLARDYVVNDVIFRNEITKVLRSDRGYAKNYEDFVKRFGTLTTPGTKPVLQGDIAPDWGLKESFTSLSIFDVKNTTQSMDFYNMMLEMNKTHAPVYQVGGVNKSDAQGIMSIHFWRNWMQGVGQWTNDHEAAYNNYNKYGKFATPKGIRPPIVPIKPYFEAVIPHPETGKMTPYTIKNSYVVLLKEFTQDKPIFDNLRRRMEADGEYKGLSRVDVINTETTFKLAKHNLVEASKDPGSLAGAESISFPSEGFVVPQFKPTADQTEALNRLGSQLIRLGISKLRDSDANYILNRALENQVENLSGEQMFNLYQEALSSKIRDSINGLREEFGYSIDGGEVRLKEGKANRLRFLKKVRERLQSVVEERGLPYNYEKALDIVASENQGWDYNVPLSFPAIARKFEQALFSIFRNEIMAQKMKVKNVVQMAELGGHVKRGDLRFVATKDGFDYAEVAVSRDVAKAIGLKAGETLENLPESLRRFVGYRVPTQGKNSSLPFRIVEILPKGYEGTIMVPGEITAQMGSDFDVDSLFLVLKNSERINNELRKIEPDYSKIFNKDGSINKEHMSSLSMEAKENIISDVLESVLRSEAHFEELTTPLESNTIGDIAEKYRKKYAAELHPNDPMVEVHAQVRNRDGSTGIGIYANQLSAHVTNIHGNARLQHKVAVRFNGEERTSLYSEIDREGNLVENNISQHLTASVDNAKDSVMYFINDNAVTSPVTAVMLSAGLTIEDATYFRNQSIIRDFVKFYNNKQDVTSVSAAMEEFAGIDSRLGAEFKVAKRTSNLSRQQLENESAPPKVVFSNFAHYHKAGDHLQKLNKISLPNRISDMSTLAAISEFQSLKHFVETDNSFVIENTREITEGNHYEINKAFLEGIEEAVIFSNSLFPYGPISGTGSNSKVQVAIAQTKDEITQLLSLPFLTKEHHSAINEFVFLDIMSKARGPLSNTFTVDRVNELLLSTTDNISHKLDRMVSKYPKLNQNPFVRHLQPHFQNDFKGEFIKRIKFDNSYAFSQEQKDSFTHGFQEMLMMPEIYGDAAEIKQFARDLIDFGLLAYGFSPAGESFLDLIPIDFWTNPQSDAPNVEMSAVEHYKRELSEMVDENTYFEGLSDTFIKHSVQMKGLIPYVDITGAPEKYHFHDGDARVFNSSTERYTSYFKTYNKNTARHELYVFQGENTSGEIEYVKTQSLGEKFKLNEVNLTRDGKTLSSSIHPVNSGLPMLSPSAYTSKTEGEPSTEYRDPSLSIEAQEAQPEVREVVPTVDTSKSWNTLKIQEVFTDEGVNTMRTSNKEAEHTHFGNPFSESGINNTIKVSSVEAAVQAYKNWLLTEQTPIDRDQIITIGESNEVLRSSQIDRITRLIESEYPVYKFTPEDLTNKQYNFAIKLLKSKGYSLDESGYMFTKGGQKAQTIGKVNPEQREWILEQINSGKLDGATLLYDSKLAARGKGTHAHALAEVIEEIRSVSQSPNSRSPFEMPPDAQLSLQQMAEQNVVMNKTKVLKDTFADHGVQVEVLRDNEIEGHAQVDPPVDGVYTIRLSDQAFSSVETQIHEFGHIYIDMLGYDSEIVQQGINQLKDSELWAEIESLYGDQFKHLDAEQREIALGKEVLATAVGVEGSNYLNQPWWKAWWNRLANAIKNLFGIETNVARRLSEQMLRNNLEVHGLPANITQYAQSAKDRKNTTKVASLLEGIRANLRAQLEQMTPLAEKDQKLDWVGKRERLIEKIENVENEHQALTEFVDQAHEDLFALAKRFDGIKSVPADKRGGYIKELANIKEYMDAFRILPEIRNEMQDPSISKRFNIPDSQKPAHLKKLETAIDVYDAIQSEYQEVAIPAMADALFPYFHERASEQLLQHIEQIKANPDRAPGLGHWKGRKGYKQIIADQKSGEITAEQAKQKKSEFLIEQLKNKQPTRANLVRWLTEAEKDQNYLSMWFDPQIYSSDQATQAFTLLVKDRMFAIHDRTLELRNELITLYEDVKRITGRSGINQADFNEGIYETITVQQTDQETGETSEVEVLSFVQPYDVSSFHRTKNAFFQDLNNKYNYPSDKSEIEQWKMDNPSDNQQRSREISRWFSENTVPIDNAQQLIKEREANIDTINEQIVQLREKAKRGEISEFQAQERIENRENTKKQISKWLADNYANGVYRGELIRPATGETITETNSRGEVKTYTKANYTNQKYTDLHDASKTPTAILNYYNELMRIYKEHQSMIGSQNIRMNTWDNFTYRTPSVRKTKKDVQIEDGTIKHIQEHVDDNTTILATDESYGVLDQVNPDYKTIPVFYTRTVSQEKVTRDLAGAMLKYGHMAIAFQEKSKILSHVQLMKTIMENRPVRETDAKGEGVMDRAFKAIGVDKFRHKNDNRHSVQAFNEFIENVFYGISDVKVEFDIGLGTMEANKITNTMSRYASNIVFPMNFLQGTANVFLGNNYLAAEGVAQEFYGKKAYTKAKQTFWENFGALIGDIGKPQPTSKFGQMIEKFDMQQGSVIESLGVDTFGSRIKNVFSVTSGYWIQRVGELEMAMTPALAKMEEFIVRDSQGNTIKNDKGNDMNLYEAYKLNSKTNKYELDNRVANFSEADFNQFRNEVHAINRKLQGIYNKFDRSPAKRRWWGKMALLFRSWLVPGFRRHYGFQDGVHVDHEMGHITEGTYITAARYAKEVFNNYGRFLKTYQDMTAMEQRNMLRVLTQKTQVLAAMVLVAMLRPDPDDNEENTFAQNFMLYQARRNQAELSIFMRPFTEGQKVLRSPAATMLVTERVIRFGHQILNPLEEYERAVGLREAGDLKIGKRIVDMIPVWNALERSATPMEAFKNYERNF